MTEQAPPGAPGDGRSRSTHASAPPGYSTLRAADQESRSAPPAPPSPAMPVDTGAPVYGRVTRFGVPEALNGSPHPVHAVARWSAPPPAAGLQRADQPVAWPAPLPWAGASSTGPAPAPAPARGRRTDYASWSRRVAGALVDGAPGLVAGIVLQVAYVPLYVGLLRGDLTAQPTWSLFVVGTVLTLAAFGWSVYNRWVLAGRTGQSVGKRATGTWLVGTADDRPIGALDALVRDLLHVLDGLGLVGYLWPLWDEERQTLADKLAQTVVVRTPVAPLSELERIRRL